MENGSPEKDTLIRDWEELYDYMRLYDMSENRILFGLQPYVVPERLMTTFSSKSGRCFQDLLKYSNRAKDGRHNRIEKLNCLKYIKSPQYDQKSFARIPTLDNNMILYLLYPDASHSKENTKDIRLALAAEIEEKTKVMILIDLLDLIS